MPVRTAVVGGGVVSKRHLSGLARSPNVELVAICDLDEGRARGLGREYDIAAYFALDEMLMAEALDWLHICTPVQTHRDLAIQAIEAGVHVQIEKPATVSVEEFQDVRDAADRHDVSVSVVRNHLFDIAGRTAQSKIESGDLGRVRGVDVVATGKTPPDTENRGDWAFDLPGGEFEEGVPHQVYLALALGGHPRSLEDVHATTALAGAYDQDFTYDGLQLQWVTDDEVLCSVKLLAGAVPQRLLLVHGDEASLAVDLLSQTTVVLDRDYGASPVARALSNVDHVLGRVGGTVSHLVGMAERTVASDWETEKGWNAHYYQFDEEAQALLRGEELPVSLDEVAWTIRLMELVRASADRRDRTPAGLSDREAVATGDGAGGDRAEPADEPVASGSEPAANED